MNKRAKEPEDRRRKPSQHQVGAKNLRDSSEKEETAPYVGQVKKHESNIYSTVFQEETAKKLIASKGHSWTNFSKMENEIFKTSS